MATCQLVVPFVTSEPYFIQLVRQSRLLKFYKHYTCKPLCLVNVYVGLRVIRIPLKTPEQSSNTLKSWKILPLLHGMLKILGYTPVQQIPRSCAVPLSPKTAPIREHSISAARFWFVPSAIIRTLSYATATPKQVLQSNAIIVPVDIVLPVNHSSHSSSRC